MAGFGRSIRGFGAGVLRSLPQFRGKIRLCNALNRLATSLGAPALDTATMKDGTRIIVDLSTQTERYAFYTGYYDRELFEIVATLYDPACCFLDVGANIGFYSTFVGRLVRTAAAGGQVLSFEPFAGNFERLSENIALNDLATNCTVVNQGLSDEPGECQITLREDFFGGSGTGNAAIPTEESFDAGYATANIQLTTLDQAWELHASEDWALDFVKLDIEGHEDFCMRGGQGVLNRFRPSILMEVNKPYYEARGVDLDEIFLPLLPENYIIYRLRDAAFSAIDSLHDCRFIDNVFIVPAERLGHPRFAIFA